MKIELKTIQDVKDFVNICSKYYKDEIVAKQGRYRVDDKSILGLFSLNLLQPVTVFIDSDFDHIKNNFYFEIEKWEVGNYVEQCGLMSAT